MTHRAKPIVLPWTFLVFILFISLQAYGQECNCPPVASCSPCAGGITRITLRYTGTLPVVVSVYDNFDNIYQSTVSAGEEFTVIGQSSGGFDGNEIRIFLNGVIHIDIRVNCSLRFDPSQQHGLFRIVGAESKNGGVMCCTSNVADDDPPVITGCPADVNVTTTNGCTATATWTPPSATDCQLQSLTSNMAPGAQFPVGMSTVTYTARDINGNTQTCRFIVTVKDRLAPVVSNCPVAIEVATNGCEARATWTPPTFADNCTVVTVNTTHVPGAVFPAGLTNVNYTGTDLGGNATTCTFPVFVKDRQPPVLTACPADTSVVAPDKTSVVVSWTAPVATDNCAIASLTSSHAPGDLFPPGITTITYTATDISGNTATCSFDITVISASAALAIEPLVTPDGNGVNDHWVIGNIEKYQANTVVIIDRWGGIVYKASRYDNEAVAWRGENLKGSQVPSGTYFYTITVHTGAAVIEENGFIELVR